MASLSTYKTYDLLIKFPDWSRGPQFATERLFESFGGISREFSETFTDYPVILLDFAYAFEGRDNIWEITNFFDSLRGRQGNLWLPSWNHDIIPSSDIGASDEWIEIENDLSGFLVSDELTRKNVLFYVNASNYYIREIWNGEPFGKTLEDQGDDIYGGDTWIDVGITAPSSGELIGFRIYTDKAASGCKAKVIRDGGTDWIFVSESEEFDLSVGVNTIEFSSSITGVQSGDILGLYTGDLPSSGNNIRNLYGSDSCWYYNGDITSTTPKAGWFERTFDDLAIQGLFKRDDGYAITLESSLGADISLSRLKMACFLHFGRLDIDQLDWEFVSPTLAVTRLTFRELPHEYPS